MKVNWRVKRKEIKFIQKEEIRNIKNLKKYKIEIRDDQYSDDLDKRRGSENNDQYTKQFFEKDADESFTQMHLKSDQEITNPMKGI